MMLLMFNTLILILAFSLNLNAQTVITNTDRLSWTQGAASLIAAQAYSYIVYVDDTTRHALTDVVCSGTISPFSCNSKFPSFSTIGIHNLQITSIDVAESAKSSVFQVQVVAPVAPTNLEIIHTQNIIQATTCSVSDVQLAINKAKAGNIIDIPSGICHWTSGISWIVPENVILRGAGSSVLGGGDITTLIDDIPIDSPLLTITTNILGTFRLSGITFNGGLGVLKQSGGIVHITGLSKRVRLDHIHWNMQSYNTPNAGKWLLTSGCVYGVVDHILVDLNSQGHWRIGHPACGGTTEGDYNWSQQPNFGTSEFIYLEDSKFNAKKESDPSNLYLGTILDCLNGGRYVSRYNTIVSAGVAQTHPTGSSGRARGCRAEEIYGNTVTYDPDFIFTGPNAHQPPFTFGWVSAGTGLFWDNTSIQANIHFITLHSMRKNNDTYTQMATPDGWGYCGTMFNGIGSNWDENNNQLYGKNCFDGPGMGKGDLLTGIFPFVMNSTTGCSSNLPCVWPRQIIEPIYEWNNNFSSVSGWGNNNSVHIETDDSNRLISNESYYSAISNFNGSMGIGVGLLSERPITCTKGVAFWAVDQGGNWNLKNINEQDGALYKCASTNNWLLYYVPFTYPHPLTVN